MSEKSLQKLKELITLLEKAADKADQVDYDGLPDEELEAWCELEVLGDLINIYEKVTRHFVSLTNPNPKEKTT